MKKSLEILITLAVGTGLAFATIRFSQPKNPSTGNVRIDSNNSNIGQKNI